MYDDGEDDDDDDEQGKQPQKRQINFIFLFEPTNAQIYITTVSLYITYTPTRFDIIMSSSGSFTFVPR